MKQRCKISKIFAICNIERNDIIYYLLIYANIIIYYIIYKIKNCNNVKYNKKFVFRLKKN